MRPLGDAGHADDDVVLPLVNGTYRSRSVFWFWTLMSSLLWLLFLDMATGGEESDAATYEWNATATMATMALPTLLLVIGLWRAARSGVRVTDDAVTVRNVRRSITVPWDQVRGFAVASTAFSPLMGSVQRIDGTAVRCYGIQRLSKGGYKVTGSIHRLIAGLNARTVQEHQRRALQVEPIGDPHVGELATRRRGPALGSGPTAPPL